MTAPRRVTAPRTVPGPAGAAPGAPLAIAASGLRKRYGDVVAVDGVDLAVAAGECLAFLGPNGAGKSTTIAMLCALTRPTAGRVAIAGHDTLDDPLEARRHIGLVFQETTLDLGLTAAENLRFHADLFDIPPELVADRVGHALDLVGLTGQRDRITGTFSGGMRRRLEIARALLHRPRLLVLDEPTLGLDPHARARVWEHLRAVREREAVTVFLTTHYLDEAEQCDRIAIIDAGRIVAEGSPAALKAELTSPDASAPTLDEVFLHYTGRPLHDNPSLPLPASAPVARPREAAEACARRARPVGAEARAVRMVWRRDLLHFRRDRLGATLSMVQPLLFLFVLGVGLSGLMPGVGRESYQLFVFSGALVTAALGPAVSVGASLLWERQAGFLRELLAGPVRRESLMLGKCLGGATIATVQGTLLLAAGPLIGVPAEPVLVLELSAQLALTSLAMTALGVLVATFVRRPQTYGTAVSVLMAPLTFLSGAMFPLAAAPAWLATLALADPLTYAVDALRRTVASRLPDAPPQLFRPLAVGPWHPPILAEWILLALLATVPLVWSARRFSRAD
ncbi:ATP-binding cassette domain-containing protein [Actinomadura rupiterrae]|uniref:ATP-binding cassette domain-containing protein n=1 Tax=Actinomadura rupiterrae TaxID=559627 RepID=UPI0020A529A5|nr:ATP-binding cassette domain-containing protein [Actinomadura rupiterrae]MCP2335945.1 daunorubicin resistance ABC transporter membrane protein [Actinomadura rupiterrae]